MCGLSAQRRDAGIGERGAERRERDAQNHVRPQREQGVAQSTRASVRRGQPEERPSDNAVSD